MGRIVWSEGAAGVMKRLDPVLRQAIEQRTAYLQDTPRMYARAWNEEERFPGCRRFSVDGLCDVYYMVAAGGSDCYIMAIEEAEPDEEPGSVTGAGLDEEA